MTTMGHSPGGSAIAFRQAGSAIAYLTDRIRPRFTPAGPPGVPPGRPGATGRGLGSRVVPGSHNDAVREQFRIQAQTFDDQGFATANLDWIVAQLAPGAAEQVLDVAAGAAHIGRALAPHVRHVSALDLTPEMLAQGQELAAGAGLRNITFQLGDAAAMPWLDGQFDLVACRFTVHQVADPAAVVREMVRVSRDRIAIIDMIVSANPAVAAEANRLERLRDPSHGRTHALGEIRNLLEQAGATI